MLMAAGRALLITLILTIITFGGSNLGAQAQEAPRQPITANSAAQMTHLTTLGVGLIRDAVWSLNGARIAIARDTHVYLFDQAGSLLRNIIRPAEFNTVALSADGSLLATADVNGAVELRETDSDVIRFTAVWSADQPYQALAFSPDGRALAMSDGIQVQVWSTMPGEFAYTLLHSRPVNDFVFKPNAAGDYWLVTVTDDAGMRLWNVASEQTMSVAYLPAAATRIAASPDGSWLVVAAPGEPLMVWSGLGGNLRSVRPLDEEGRAYYGDDRPVFSADSLHLYMPGAIWTRAAVNNQTIWQKRELNVFGYKYPIRFLPSPDLTSMLIVTPYEAGLHPLGGRRENMDWFDTPLLLDQDYVWGLVFSPSGDALYAGLQLTNDSDAPRALVRFALQPEIDPVPVEIPRRCWNRNAANSEAGECFGYVPKTIPQWLDCTSGSYTLISPNGRYEALCVERSNLERIRIVDLETRVTLAEFEGSPNGYLYFSPDSRYVVNYELLGSESFVWGLATSQKMMTLFRVNSLPSFNPDSTVMAFSQNVSACPPYEHRIVLYSTATGEILNIIPTDPLPQGGVYFSPDGTLLLVEGAEGYSFDVWGYDPAAPPFQATAEDYIVPPADPWCR